MDLRWDDWLLRMQLCCVCSISTCQLLVRVSWRGVRRRSRRLARTWLLRIVALLEALLELLLMLLEVLRSLLCMRGVDVAFERSPERCFVIWVGPSQVLHPFVSECRSARKE